MRRHDREVLDFKLIQSWFDDFEVCRLGFIDEDVAYIVPLNFGVSFEPQFELYFHSAQEGKKIELMLKNPRVSFELDGRHELIEADRACDVSMAYISVMGIGTLTVLTDRESKRQALIKLMTHATQRSDWSFSDASLDRVFVYKLVVESYSAKQHIKKGS